MQIIHAWMNSLKNLMKSLPQELKIPLFWDNGGNASHMTSSLPTTAGVNFVTAGTSSGLTASAGGTGINLFTLDTKWSPQTKFALEVTGYGTIISPALNVALWDVSANAIVPGTTITFGTNSYNVPMRSSQFNLNLGDTYAVTFWVSASTSNTNYEVIDATLIVFPYA